MLKRTAIAVSLASLGLLLIDFGSSFLLPCALYYERARNYSSSDSYNDCAHNGGVIVAALELIWSFKPEAWTAIATIVIAAFTCTLWLATSRQARLTRQAINLSREEFNATHRPRLIIHFIRRFVEHPDHPASAQSIAIRFRIMNIGTGDAVVVGSRLRVDHYMPYEWPFPDDLVGANFFAGQRFKVGVAREEIIRSDIHSDQHQAVGVSGSLYFIGWIVYKDTMGNPITTYFCREYQSMSGRFIPAKNCDWENAH
jgi:hypothetical protein